MATDEEQAHPSPGGQFHTTHWSVVVLAGEQESIQAKEALAKLCGTYRPPILSFARGLGYSQADAEDLTQGYFAHFLETNLPGKAERRPGVKFRTFLLRCFKNFLADERARAAAKKRGGHLVVASLDAPTGQGQASLEPVDETTAEKIYERDWATTLLNQVLDRLENEYARRGRKPVFEQLHVFLLDRKGSSSHAEAGADLGMSEDAVKKEVSRMRQRYRELLRDEIAQTVRNANEIEEEMQHLFAVISG